jgi:hypothetical protein
MRIALSIYEEDISPRFCGADRFLIVDIEGGGEKSRRVIAAVPADFGDRLVLLRDLGVRELLCGGFNRCYLPLAEFLGLRVLWGFWGPADAVVLRRLGGQEAAPTLGPRRGRGACARRGRRP